MQRFAFHIVRWVMAALTVDDGIHDDGPVMTTAFEYKDGKRDRHERVTTLPPCWVSLKRN